MADEVLADAISRTRHRAAQGKAPYIDDLEILVGAALSRPTVIDIREVVATELERLAESDDSMVAWTQNNFIPGPNTDYSVKHHAESAGRLRNEADDWRKGYCDNFLPENLKEDK